MLRPRAKKGRATPLATGARPASPPNQLSGGNLQVLAFPDGFPNQGGLPVQVDGHTIGAIAASDRRPMKDGAAASEIDEAIAQAAIDALLAAERQSES